MRSQCDHNVIHIVISMLPASSNNVGTMLPASSNIVGTMLPVPGNIVDTEIEKESE